MNIKAISTVKQLEDMLSEPNKGVVKTLGNLAGDIIILGAGGKMGPSLTRMAKRASDAAGIKRRVIAVSTFRSGTEEGKLSSEGIETIKCDLMDPKQLSDLPDAANVVFMVGMKFGSTSQEALTWAMNAFLPGMVAQRFSNSRIVAFSTGNIYGLSPITFGGSVESDPPNPTGEYATSALGRERIFEHFSKTLDIPTAIIRLNYAVEMRYGVLVDVATKVFNEEPIDLTMGNANVIWQGDANAMVLQAFDYCANPAFFLNVAGPEIISIRRAALQFGEMMGKKVSFTGVEASDCLLNNGQLGHKLMGYPEVSVLQMMTWIADWVSRGGESLGKPTHFEARDGKF